MEKTKQQHQAEMSRLQEELLKMQAERKETENALRSQIGQAKKTKKKAIDDLKTAEKRVELSEKKLECKLLDLSMLFSRCILHLSKVTRTWLS